MYNENENNMINENERVNQPIDESAPVTEEPAAEPTTVSDDAAQTHTVEFAPTETPTGEPAAAQITMRELKKQGYRPYTDPSTPTEKPKKKKGGIAKKIVSVPGASDVYYEGINAYSGHSKMARLGVSEFTLRSQGAVSEQTAYEMAAGLLQQGNCDVAIATTGLSGPTTDESGQPVGTCYIAVGVDGDVYVYRYLLQGDREEISETAIRYALFLACKQLKNM